MLGGEDPATRAQVLRPAAWGAGQRTEAESPPRPAPQARPASAPRGRASVPVGAPAHRHRRERHGRGRRRWTVAPLAGGGTRAASGAARRPPCRVGGARPASAPVPAPCPPGSQVLTARRSRPGRRPPVHMAPGQPRRSPPRSGPAAAAAPGPRPPRRGRARPEPARPGLPHPARLPAGSARPPPPARLLASPGPAQPRLIQRLPPQRPGGAHSGAAGPDWGRGAPRAHGNRGGNGGGAGNE